MIEDSHLIRRGTRAGTLYIDKDSGEGFVVLDEDAIEYFDACDLNVKDTLTDLIGALVIQANRSLEYLEDECRVMWDYYPAWMDEDE